MFEKWQLVWFVVWAGIVYLAWLPWMLGRAPGPIANLLAYLYPTMEAERDPTRVGVRVRDTVGPAGCVGVLGLFAVMLLVLEWRAAASIAAMFAVLMLTPIPAVIIVGIYQHGYRQRVRDLRDSRNPPP